MHWNTSIRTAPSRYAGSRRDSERHPGLDSASSFGAMTVLESADRWTVEVDVPGALLADIDITLTDGSLVIEGFRKPHTEEGVKEVFNDRAYSKFRRELKVREGIDQSRINRKRTIMLSRALVGLKTRPTHQRERLPLRYGSNP